MKKILIKNAQVVNENQILAQDVLIEGERIAKVASNINVPDAEVIDATGLHLLPGMIDDQVHFREPGFPTKGTIATESRAAVAGGITSYMEMPNVKPATVTHEAIDDKLDRASKSSLANFSFYMGATNDNLEVIKTLDPTKVCGIKVFMGASTGNMLVDNQETLANIFKEAPTLIVTHCEDTPMILDNEQAYREKYGDDVPMVCHPEIRSADACYKSSTMAVELARKYNSRLHVLHLTTEKELSLFKKKPDYKSLADENISVEVCVHHLFFNSDDYEKLGSQIKCNPAVKFPSDQQALINAVNDDVIDVIATDHAPHTWDEKQGNYFAAPAGVPLVQHALLSTLEFYHKGVFSLEKIVQKTSHAVAERYTVVERGYIREGYFADLVLVDLKQGFTCSDENIYYQCGWSPFNGYHFHSTVKTTFVNGHAVYQDGKFDDSQKGQPMTFVR
ncbi:dihydroorotase [Algicola sagamiensis]|uniref:dihydroorotase n=1 Tax=Algicola sagamiensis TaxID=163869 RepID=UPI0003621018|nr:dihydroorotase [Algicola sagamiensis]